MQIMTMYEGRRLGDTNKGEVTPPPKQHQFYSYLILLWEASALLLTAYLGQKFTVMTTFAAYCCTTKA